MRCVSAGGRRRARRCRSRAPDGRAAAGSRTRRRAAGRRCAASMMIRLRRATAVSRAAMLTGGPKTSPSRIDDGAAGEAEPDVGHPRVAPDHVDDPLGDVVAPPSVRVGDEQHRVADALDDPAAVRATTSAQRALEDLDQVADPSLVELLDSAVKLTRCRRSRRVTSMVWRSSSLAPQRLDPGHGGGEVAAPGVDEQSLEGRVDLLDQAQRRPDAEPVASVARRHLLDPADQRGDLPVGEPGHRLADARGSGSPPCRSRSAPESTKPMRVETALMSAARVGLLAAELGEAQRAPQPAGLLDRRRRSRRRPRGR